MIDPKAVGQAASDAAIPGAHYIQVVVNFEFFGTAMLLLYVIPVLLSLLHYWRKSSEEYDEDLKKRDTYLQRKGDPSHPFHASATYSPTLTRGLILGRVLLSFVPLWNLLQAIFNYVPGLVSGGYDWLVKTFDIPLVQLPKDYAKK